MLILGGLLICASRGLAASGTSDPSGQESAAAVIEKVLDSGGLDAARARFLLMRIQQEPFAFEEGEWISLGRRLMRSGRASDAAGILEMAVDTFPDSINIRMFLAMACYSAGDYQAGLVHAQKMIDLRGKAGLAGFLKNNPTPPLKTARQVLDRHLEVTGGASAWKNVRTLVVVLRGHDTRGRNPERIIRMYKRPALFRQGIEGGDRFMASDGETVWSVSGKEWKTVDPAANPYHRLGSIDNWMLADSGRGITNVLVGLEPLNYAPVYHIRRTFPDGFEQDLYFSAITGFLTEIRSEYIAGLAYMTSYFSLWDYRKTQDISLPNITIRNIGPLGPPHGAVVEEVKINVPLEDALFLPPERRPSGRSR